MSIHENTNHIGVVAIPPRLKISTFAIALPPSTAQGWDEPLLAPATRSLFGEQGIVGTITRLRKSVIIWFGWGAVESQPFNHSSGESEIMFGKASERNMGPLIVSMPRTTYRGAFSTNSNECATSKLIGSDSDDEEMISRQMSSRLSQKLGVSVFLSCSFAGCPDVASQGIDQSIVQHKAAAIAERELYKLLKDEYKVENA